MNQHEEQQPVDETEKASASVPNESEEVTNSASATSPPEADSPDVGQQDDVNESVTAAREEAAKYRTRLREVEEERERIKQQTETLQQQMLRMYVDLGVRPKDYVPQKFFLKNIEDLELFIPDTPLPSYFKDSGELDVDKLRKNILHLKMERPELFNKTIQVEPDRGMRDTPLSLPTSFEASFAPKEW